MRLGVRFGFQVISRSGGHSYIANELGGKNGSFAIDMNNFNTVSVDPTTHIATIGLGSVALALNATGWAMPHGTFPYVGICGHSGQGGYGFTSRKWGLTLDIIQSLEAVPAHESIVAAPNSINGDLF